MNVLAVQKELKILISKGEHEEVIETLLDLSSKQSEKVSNRIYSISASFENLKTQISYGTISDERKELSTNEITRRLITVVNSLEKPISGSPKTKEVNPTKGQLFLKIFPLFATGVVLFSVILFIINKTDYNQNNWIGQWEQLIETAGNSQSKGTLEFKLQDDKLAGESVIKYKTGYWDTLTLSHIVLEDKKSKIGGKWTSKIIDNEGSFSLKLTNNNEFEGRYYISGDSNEYSWRGTLINK